MQISLNAQLRRHHRETIVLKQGHIHIHWLEVVFMFIISMMELGAINYSNTINNGNEKKEIKKNYGGRYQ